MWSNLHIQMDTDSYWTCLALTTDLKVPSVTSFSGGLNVSGVISRARDLLGSNIGSVSSSLQASVAEQPKHRRIDHQYTHKSVKQPEHKTLEISVVDFMACEEFSPLIGPLSGSCHYCAIPRYHSTGVLV